MHTNTYTHTHTHTRTQEDRPEYLKDQEDNWNNWQAEKRAKKAARVYKNHGSEVERDFAFSGLALTCTRTQPHNYTHIDVFLSLPPSFSLSLSFCPHATSYQSLFQFPLSLSFSVSVSIFVFPPCLCQLFSVCVCVCVCV